MEVFYTMKRSTKLYKRLAQLLIARTNCIKHDNAEWKARHEDEALRLVKEHLPSGSGVDRGTKLDLDRSSGDKLVFQVAFHHMDEHGYYDGWTDHEVIVTASLWSGCKLRITGRNRNDIKDYLGDLYHEALSTQITVGEDDKEEANDGA